MGQQHYRYLLPLPTYLRQPPMPPKTTPKPQAPSQSLLSLLGTRLHLLRNLQFWTMRNTPKAPSRASDPSYGHTTPYGILGGAKHHALRHRHQEGPIRPQSSKTGRNGMAAAISNGALAIAKPTTTSTMEEDGCTYEIPSEVKA